MLLPSNVTSASVVCSSPINAQHEYFDPTPTGRLELKQLKQQLDLRQTIPGYVRAEAHRAGVSAGTSDNLRHSMPGSTLNR
jgi:hypothetical protein